MNATEFLHDKRMAVTISKKISLYIHDELPEFPEGIAEPTTEIIDFDDGVRTTFGFGAADTFWLDLWTTFDGTYNSIDDGGRDETWPSDWNEEQVDGVREWASAFHQHVDADVYGLTVDLVTGRTSAAILANARGASKPCDPDSPAPARGAKRAAEILDVWVDVTAEEPETYIRDALTDLRHYCAEHNVDIEAVFASSRASFDDEVNNPLF